MYLNCHLPMFTYICINDRHYIISMNHSRLRKIWIGYKWNKALNMINMVFLDIGVGSSFLRVVKHLNVLNGSLVGEYTYTQYQRYKKKGNGNMDRGHGATYAGGDNHLLEYWEEYQKMIEETKMLDDYLDEECSPRSYDGMYLNYYILYLINTYINKLSKM